MYLAELMFLKKETESAIYHFQQLLEKRPNYYVALETLLRLLRHAGKLTEAQRYLELAESKATRPTREAGLQFCKGLYNRFINNLHEALHCFNLSRKDQRWGPLARYHMVEIYLDPNKDAFLGEQENGGTVDANHIENARRLLKEIVQRGRPEDKVKKDILECYCMIATGNKQNIEMALKQFQTMMGSDPDNVPAMLGMSVAHIRLKQQPKARNMLKRICKLDYKPEMAEDFERSWLMLADLYCSSGKYDLAQDLCKKCLTHNQSCAKAWEYLGLVMEKEQSYADAADAYERAWHFESERSASVGFKLGFNYLKAKRNVEAVDICHQVLEKFPNYPKIREKILDKARENMRSGD